MAGSDTGGAITLPAAAGSRGGGLSMRGRSGRLGAAASLARGGVVAVATAGVPAVIPQAASAAASRAVAGRPASGPVPGGERTGDRRAGSAGGVPDELRSGAGRLRGVGVLRVGYRHELRGRTARSARRPVEGHARIDRAVHDPDRRAPTGRSTTVQRHRRRRVAQRQRRRRCRSGLDRGAQRAHP